MHEVSIMFEVLKLIEEEAVKNHVEKVEKIKLSIGKQMLVMPDALLFAFETLKQGRSESAILSYEIVEGRSIHIDYIEGEEEDE
ncbi:hydrogenase/urease maturation nickel metallochaperone HypA [Thalassobacillus hwangdonensis]|uniref:Hydrogenase/urease maturation nickel metallochaperone HypA n=1 Tax=Thalassobacillus hwangdonensis TaxID=546108 RepID=A0ABW3KZ76_9BACI